MRRSVTLDRAGLAIDGRLIYLLAGQLHYFRFPRAEWRDQLLKARAGGLNTIDTVIPWNLHEPIAGQFDFADQADLPAYLDLCAELGLWAIVRPGPYICAEWENGGLPAWLTAQPGLQLRIDDPHYLAALARWFDRLMPLLCTRQASASGPIILCQIENEHWASGRYGHDMHQATLARMATERGIDVPQYTCMGATPDWPEFRNGWSGIAEKLVQTRARWPDNPMIVSELWSGWFDSWGSSRHNHKTAARLDQTLAQLLAVGASGLSHWMWAGGTNFGFWGGRTVGGDTVMMTTSYDYDAPVSEYGGLTEKFFVARRHHLLLGTLGAPLAAALADAVPGGPTVLAPAAVQGRGEAGAAPYRNLRAAADAAPAWAGFTATFLHNPGFEGQTYQLFLPQAHLAVEVPAGTIRPIWGNLPLDAAGLVLRYHTAPLLGFWQRGQVDLLVAYGRPGEAGELLIEGPQPWQLCADGGTDCQLDGSALHCRFWIGDRPRLVQLRGARELLLVLLTDERAARWWPLDDGFVCGPHLLLCDDDRTWIDRRGLQPFYRIALDGAITQLDLPDAPADRQASGAAAGPSGPLAWPAAQTDRSGRLHWTRHPAAALSAQADWLDLAAPQSLDALGCLLGYGWYRARFQLAAPRRAWLAAPWLADRALLFVDGVHAGWLGLDPHGPRLAIELDLPAGLVDLRLLIDNLGRFNYGSNTGEQKGLLDTLYWEARQEDITAGWVALWQEAVFAGEALAAATPAALRPDARAVRLDRFAFAGPSVWLLREIEVDAGRRYLLHMTGDRNPGALFVNGQAVTRFSRHYGGGYIKRDITDWLRPGRNVLALNIQGYAGAAWRATLLSYADDQPLVADWGFRPGVVPGDAAPGSGPAFYRAQFDYDPALQGGGPFALCMEGMSKGQIWLNGHNLGRYWQIGPQERYKVPASWLLPQNELLLFDERGASPDAVWLARDQLGADELVALL